MHGRNQKALIVRHPELLQTPEKLTYTGIAIRDARKPSREPHILVEKPCNLYRDDLRFSAAGTREDDAMASDSYACHCSSFFRSSSAALNIRRCIHASFVFM